MTHHVMRYYVMDMDTIQVVQVIIVVNTAIIIEMGMLQDGMLQLMQIVMDNNNLSPPPPFSQAPNQGQGQVKAKAYQ